MSLAPPSSPRVQRKRRARREAILRSAVELVAEHGIERLSLHGLARSLGYTVGALYRYFPSKDALVAELQRGVVGGLGRATLDSWARCESLAAERGVSARQRALLPLLVTADLYSRLAREAPEHFGLLSRSLGDPGPMIEDREARRVLAAARPIFDGLARHFERASATGALSPGAPRPRALAYWACLHGIVQLRKLGRLDRELVEADALLEVATSGLLHGWGATPRLLVSTRRLAASPTFTEVDAFASGFQESTAMDGARGRRAGGSAWSE